MFHKHHAGIKLEKTPLALLELGSITQKMESLREYQ